MSEKGWAPRVHWARSPTARIAACGQRQNLDHDEANVTCRRCLDAISRAAVG